MNEKVIGIHDGHDASIALLEGGKITCALQEERFTNRKNEVSFPYHAACWLKENYDLSGISRIVLGTGWVDPALAKIKREINFSLQDYIHEQHAFWKKRLIDGESVNYFDVFGKRPDFDYDKYYCYDGVTFNYDDPKDREIFAKHRINFVSKLFGVDPSAVYIYDHELSHQYYALYGSPIRNEDAVIVTCEGRGTYSNATISIYRNSRIREIKSMTDHRLATIYRYVTLILGMKPNEHEYKVMGLAPYAKMYDVRKVLPIFEDLMKVDGIDCTWRNQPPDLYFTLKDRLEGKRFDHIAGALQLFAENLSKKWFRAIVKHTGIRKFVFSGGFAQNIKAAKEIASLDEVEELFICPAAGDTSLSIGAAYYGYIQIQAERGEKAIQEPEALKNVYLGHEYTHKEYFQAINKDPCTKKYHIEDRVTNGTVARLLSSGKVIARFSGKMEFGLRALGNRSILADPRNASIVQVINSKIKNRDFWMPFTPTILDTYADKYLVNPKKLKSPFMTMAFDTTELGREVLAAAIHPADFTARPQILTREANPDYYDLIESFAQITGVGALLNTSFNLHGSPITGNPLRAIETLEKSELDGLLLGDILMLRNSGKGEDSSEEALLAERLTN